MGKRLCTIKFLGKNAVYEYADSKKENKYYNMLTVEPR